jgi:RHS repeat-associated protein
MENRGGYGVKPTLVIRSNNRTIGTDMTAVANHRVFDSYGNLKSQTNAVVDCLFGFTGRPMDQATGLQNNLNRWYDPIVAGWVSQDQIIFYGRQTNLYVYCGNNPMNNLDPTGLWVWPWDSRASWNVSDTARLWRESDYVYYLPPWHNSHVDTWDTAIKYTKWGGETAAVTAGAALGGYYAAPYITPLLPDGGAATGGAYDQYYRTLMFEQLEERAAEGPSFLSPPPLP